MPFGRSVTAPCSRAAEGRRPGEESGPHRWRNKRVTRDAQSPMKTCSHLDSAGEGGGAQSPHPGPRSRPGSGPARPPRPGPSQAKEKPEQMNEEFPEHKAPTSLSSCSRPVSLPVSLPMSLPTPRPKSRSRSAVASSHQHGTHVRRLRSSGSLWLTSLCSPGPATGRRKKNRKKATIDLCRHLVWTETRSSSGRKVRTGDTGPACPSGASSRPPLGDLQACRSKFQTSGR